MFNRAKAFAVALVVLCAMAPIAVAQKSKGEKCAAHPHPAQEQRALAQVVFNKRNWRHPEIGQGRLTQMRQLRSCADATALPAMRKSWKSAKRHLYKYRELRLVAPYPGPKHSWWAIPYYIPSCESGGGNFPNFHPTSGILGAGAYGILVPQWHQYGDSRWPNASAAPPLAQHKAARRIWLDVGPGAWSCA